MRRFSGISLLVIITILLCFITGCSTGKSTAGSKSDDASQKQQTEAQDAQAGEQTAADQADANADNKGASSDDKKGQSKEDAIANSPLSRYTEEERQQMGSITGTWEAQRDLGNGQVDIVRLKIDNIGGLTLTTGTANPDGQGSFYSRVGSYEVADGTLTFMATTGGESSDGSTYELRQDPGVFEYTYSVNEDRTQLTLTPKNEKAQQLNGPEAIVLNKT